MGSGRVAGPCVTAPVAENSLPWHGHENVSPVVPRTQPRCVQMSEYTAYLPSRFWTAAGCPFTTTAVSWPAGKVLEGADVGDLADRRRRPRRGGLRNCVIG